MDYTNRQTITESIQMYDLAIATSYAVIIDEPSQVVLDNRTASLDQQELISFRRRKVAQVNTDLNLQYPPKVKGGVSYAAQSELTVVNEDSVLGREDLPSKMYLTLVHTLNGAMTNAILNEQFDRLVSALPRTVVDGKVVIDFLALARGALRP